MTNKERFILVGILLIIGIATIVDIIADLSEGSGLGHVSTEAVVAVISLFGVFYLLSGTFSLKRDLAEERQESSRLKDDLATWKENSRKHVEGLSKSIEEQLDKWSLTPSEKEIAFLILKGLSLKEISEIRSTSEKTVRSQSASIYTKAGLANRSQLSAFFLEDLLVPSTRSEI